MGRWGARGSPRCPPRGQRPAPGPVRRPRDPAGSGPGGPGSSDAARPRAHGPFGGDVTVGGTGHASPESPDRGEPASSLAPAPWRQGPREEGAGAGRRAASPSAAGARGCQDAGGDIWSLGRAGGPRRRGGGEAKHQSGPRPLRPQLPRTPVFPASPFSFLGLLVLLKSTPRAGVRTRAGPSWEPAIGRRWGGGVGGSAGVSAPNGQNRV